LQNRLGTFTIRAMGWSLGIDIGGTSVKLAMLRDGRVEWTGQSAFYARPTTQQLVEALKDAARGRIGATEVAGLCVPGRLDAAARVITLSVNVPGLMNVKLDDLIARAFGEAVKRIEIINDAVAAAYDLYALRRMRGRLVSIALGTGVGMAVLDDGKPLFIEGASPGHIGQVDVSVSGDDVIGPDGGAGSLEGYIGVPALVGRYGSVEKFLASAKATDGSLMALVRAIRICHAIYRPQQVALVGGVGTRMTRMIDVIKRAVDTNLTSVADKTWGLTTGEHDFHAAAGAARLAVTSLE
jgi:predicted NBD/HSP70 family sugar kinase